MKDMKRKLKRFFEPDLRDTILLGVAFGIAYFLSFRFRPIDGVFSYEYLFGFILMHLVALYTFVALLLGLYGAKK
ncbi:MAG: hypothetical protein ACMXYK_03265 [Candidatus Woesearchaeota archaeon]